MLYQDGGRPYLLLFLCQRDDDDRVFEFRGEHRVPTAEGEDGRTIPQRCLGGKEA